MVDLANWFKTSIIGIVLLGSVGSILAVFIIGGVKWFTKRYILEFILSYLAQHARSYASGVLLTQRFVKRNQIEKLIFQCVFFVGGSLFSTSVLLTLIAATFVVIYRSYSQHLPVSGLGIGLIITTLVCFHSWFKDMSFTTGMYSVLIADDLKAVRSLLEKHRSVEKILELDEGKTDRNRR